MLPIFNYKQTNNFIDILYNLTTYLPFEKKTLAIIIRSLHILLPYIFIIFLLHNKKKFKPIIGIIIIFALSGFILFGKCWVSLLEKKLSNDQFNIMDPYIEIFHFEKNNKNRMVFTFILTAIYAIFVYYI